MPLSAQQMYVCESLLVLSRMMCRPPFYFGGRGRAKLDSLVDYAVEVAARAPGDVAPPPAALVGATFKADRAEFMTEHAHFDPTPHLDVLDAACYVEPRLLELGAPACPLPRAGMRGQRHEVLRYVRRMDEFGKLHLAAPADAPKEDRMSLIAVYKSEARDRTVWDRRRRNWKEVHLRGGARDLPGGYNLAEFELLPGQNALLFGDDLRDFYPSFDAPPARAVTNALALEVSPAEVKGTRALRRFAGQPPALLVPCAASLVMGDLNAVDWATAAHREILESAGALPREEQVLQGRPFPRGPCAHALVIDDHVAVVASDGKRSPAAERAAAAFDRAGPAYEAAGVHRHPDKQVRGAPEGVLIGAEILGREGYIGAERLRRVHLSALTLLVLSTGIVTGALLRRLVSSWVYVLLFRRPLLCLLGAAFKELPDIRQDSLVFKLSAATRQELAQLAALAPAMCTNMRASHSDQLIATDASSFALGATAAPLPPAVHQALWRHRERRGWPTHLCGKQGEWIRACAPERVAAEFEEEVAARYVAQDYSRNLVERFDVLELCCGKGAPFLAACARMGLRCGPRIDLLLHPMWDLRSGRVIEWVLHLVSNNRVRYIHCGAPCTTFSIARHPRLRSVARPLGFHPAEPCTLLGNVLLFRTLLVLWACRRSGTVWGTHEHPASAYSWKIPQVRELFDGPGCGTMNLSMCQYGMPYRKNTRFGLVDAEFLRPLGRQCCGGHAHVELQGAATTRASAYPPLLCQEWAELVAAKIASVPDGGDVQVPDAAPPAGAFESLAFNELVRSAPWRVAMRRPCDSNEHINILEVRAQVKTMNKVASSSTSSRQLYAMDSRVGLGCLSKGRSPSHSLNDEVKQGVPAIIAHDHYPGYLFSPTRINPGDCPTRDKPLPVPSAAPAWLRSAAAGDLGPFDQWIHLPLQTRAVSEWARFTAQLLMPSGRDVWPVPYVVPPSTNFDKTKGYDGEGPRRQALPLQQRPAVWLPQHRTLGPATVERRRRLVEAFAAWLLGHCGVQLEQLIAGEGRVVSRYLEQYGQRLYEQGAALGTYLETVNGVVDRDRALRRQLQAAWDLAAAWRLMIPASNRVPTPAPMLLAMVALALTWGWLDIAVGLYLSFVAMLRPGELLRLVTEDILVPSLLLSRRGVAYVRISHPKMRRLAARREHVRIEDPMLVRLLEALRPTLRPGQRLIRAEPREYAQLHSSLVSFFGVSPRDGAGITPASHRAGGATYMFEMTGSVEATRWRGRWGQTRTLEIYIQEVAAAILLPNLEPAARERIALFARTARALLEQTLANLLS